MDILSFVVVDLVSRFMSRPGSESIQVDLLIPS